MQKTQIEWVKNPDGSQGYTWNPLTGCLNGCPYCYARRLANGRLKHLYLANKNIPPIDSGYAHEEHRKWVNALNDPFYPRFWENRLREGIFSLGRKPKGIFVCDMSDLFGMGIPYKWQHKVMSVIKMDCYKQHRFYLLTKQPQNLIKFSPFPDNCWVGVTVTNEEAMRSLYHLAYVQAGKRFASFEPLLGSVNFNGQTVSIPWAGGRSKGGHDYTPLIDFIDWVIIGAQTKPYKPPKIEWVQEIVEACGKAGIPVFLKDNLRPLLNGHPQFFEDIPHNKGG